MVIRLPDGTATTIDFREVAPQNAHREMFLDKNGEIIPDLSTLGYLACGVPGSVAGLTYALEKYGTFSLKKILAPAIKLAQEGFPVDFIFHQDLVRLREIFLKFPASARVFLKNGEPYAEGERFIQKDLAKSLKIIAKKGTQGFYTGPIAELIVKDMAQHRGLITRDDLAKYQPQERPPVRGTYRNFEIISMPPPSSGGIAILQLFNILESRNLNQLGYHASAHIHLLAEAFRRVFADRSRHLGDPDFWDVPVAGLISKAYAAQLQQPINPFTATPSASVLPGDPIPYESSETTHYSVVDKNRMAVAVTTTINTGYGSKVVITGAGFLMNNEMDDFASKPNTPNAFGLIGTDANAIQPRKRMLSSMSPTIVIKDNQPLLVVGAMGGPAIISSVAQTILNVIDFGMNIQAAIDAPKMHHQWIPDHILYEKFCFPKDVLENLTRMGHAVVQRNNVHSETNGIQIDPQTGVLLGGADSRLKAAAVGY
jgi:gamma-glutamyltranspeptidase/glutathione hydrolase